LDREEDRQADEYAVQQCSVVDLSAHRDYVLCGLNNISESNNAMISPPPPLISDAVSGKIQQRERLTEG
jgi:hypothetical protein